MEKTFTIKSQYATDVEDAKLNDQVKERMEAIFKEYSSKDELYLLSNILCTFISTFTMIIHGGLDINILDKPEFVKNRDQSSIVDFINFLKEENVGLLNIKDILHYFNAEIIHEIYIKERESEVKMENNNVETKRGSYTYPCIFTKYEDDSYEIRVPDLDVMTCGDNYEEAVKMAKDLISITLADYMDENKEIPKAGTKTILVCTGDGESIVEVTVDMDEEYDKVEVIYDDTIIKIPVWLKIKAEGENIDLSETLIEALKGKLNLQ